MTTAHKNTQYINTHIYNFIIDNCQETISWKVHSQYLVNVNIQHLQTSKINIQLFLQSEFLSQRKQSIPITNNAQCSNVYQVQLISHSEQRLLVLQRPNMSGEHNCMWQFM